jgi:hypothetical protein
MKTINQINLSWINPGIFTEVIHNTEHYLQLPDKDSLSRVNNVYWVLDLYKRIPFPETIFEQYFDTVNWKEYTYITYTHYGMGYNKASLIFDGRRFLKRISTESEKENIITGFITELKKYVNNLIEFAPNDVILRKI